MSESILKLLRGSDRPGRLKGLLALHQQQGDLVDQELLLAVGEQLNHSDINLRFSASLVLAEKASATYCMFLLPMIARAATDPEPMIKQRILALLRRLAPDATVLAIAQSLLTDSDDAVRIDAAAVVWHQTKDALSIKKIISYALQSSDSNCLARSCQLVHAIGQGAAEYLEPLLHLLRHDNGIVRSNALAAIRSITSDQLLLREIASSLTTDLNPMVCFIAKKVLKELE